MAKEPRRTLHERSLVLAVTTCLLVATVFPKAADAQWVMEWSHKSFQELDNSESSFNGADNGIWVHEHEASARLPTDFLIFFFLPRLSQPLPFALIPLLRVTNTHYYKHPEKSEIDGSPPSWYREYHALLDGKPEPDAYNNCDAIIGGPTATREGPIIKEWRPGRCRVKILSPFKPLGPGGYRVTSTFETSVGFHFVPQEAKPLVDFFIPFLPKDNHISRTPEARFACRENQTFNSDTRICECDPPLVFEGTRCREVRSPDPGPDPDPNPDPNPDPCITDECRCELGLGSRDVCYDCTGATTGGPITICELIGFVGGIPIFECWEVDLQYQVACDYRFDKQGQPPGSPRPSICTDGESWASCIDGAGNQLPFVTEVQLPEHRYEWLFPPCHHSAAGNPVTPCNGNPSDPDLVVSSASHSPALPEVGEPVDLTVKIRNTGGQAAPNTRFRVSFSGGGGAPRQAVFWVGSLTPGAERSFSVSSLDAGYTVRSGQNDVEIVVDADDELTEGREDNNDRLLSFDGQSSPSGGVDLRVRALISSPTHPVEGDEATASFEVVNSGSSASPAVRYHLGVGGPSGVLLDEYIQVAALDAGDVQTEEFSFHGNEAGDFTVYLHVDPGDEVPESSESNNALSATVTFAEDNPCLPCTTGAPNNGIGATVCAPGTDPEGDQWICRGVRADGTTCVADGNHPNGWDWNEPRCPDPATLAPGWHADVCGIPDICPGAGTAP